MLGVLELKVGTKNPHHTFMCKKWTRNFSGVASCTEFCSSSKFYKQTLLSKTHSKFRNNLDLVANYYDKLPLVSYKDEDYVLREKIKQMLIISKRHPSNHPQLICNMNNYWQVHAVTHVPVVHNQKTVLVPQLPGLEKLYKPSFVVSCGSFIGGSEDEIIDFCNRHGLCLPDIKGSKGELHLFLLNQLLANNLILNKNFTESVMLSSFIKKYAYDLQTLEFLEMQNKLEKDLKFQEILYKIKNKK